VFHGTGRLFVDSIMGLFSGTDPIGIRFALTVPK
jgi:hypothetical protein